MKTISTNYFKLRITTGETKYSPYKLLILAIIIALVGTMACANQKLDKDISLVVRLKLDAGKTNDLLKVSRKGDGHTWDGSLAQISWWDNSGNVQSGDIISSNGWLFERKSNEAGYTINCTQPELGFSFTINIIPKDDILTVSVPYTEILETGEARLKELRLLPNFGAAKRGDKGYLVIPKDVGLLCNFNDKEPSEFDLPVYGVIDCNMPLFGMVQGEGAYAGIITDGQFDAKYHITTNSGVKGIYSIDPVFTLRSFIKEDRLSDDLTVEYHFLDKEDANWLGVAKRYREYNEVYRKIQPLRERVKFSPELAYSAQALEVRMRMGVKPVPTPVVEQTLENEPQIRVFLTFDKLQDIFDEFHKQGIRNTEFCIVGWHRGGHSGRYPQYFPVEPAFGGEEKLRKAIAFGQSLGFQIVSHDLYDYSYPISTDWDEANLRVKADGKYWTVGPYAGGRGYKLCLLKAYELFVKRDEPRVRGLGFKGLHYNDVLSIERPMPCYNPEHPATRRQDAEARNKIMAFSKELFGGVQSEGPLDFAAPVMDRVLYLTMHSNTRPELEQLSYVDEVVPLYPAVYHGTLLYNIWNDCVNAVPGSKFYLKNIEYGGMPVAYFYGNYRLDDKNWLGDRDLRYNSSEGLKEAVSSVKPVYNDLEKLKHLQMEFIEGHKKLVEGVFETLYSNGERVVVNYNNVPYRISSGEEIPPLGFKLFPNQN